MLAQRLACSPDANIVPQRPALSQHNSAELVRLARTAAEGCGNWTAPCTSTVVPRRLGSCMYPCSRISYRSTCYVSAGCSAPDPILGTNSTQSMYSMAQHGTAQHLPNPQRTPVQRSWADDRACPSGLPAFSWRASLRTGCEPHWPGDALRHLGSETQADQEQAPYHKRREYTVCGVLGPARARFGSIACPSDSILEVGRTDRASHRPCSHNTCYISSPLICSHMIAVGRSLSREPPGRLKSDLLLAITLPEPLRKTCLLSALPGITQADRVTKKKRAREKCCGRVEPPQGQAPSSAERLFDGQDSLDCQATLNRLSRFTPASYAVVPRPVNMVDPVPINPWLGSGWGRLQGSPPQPGSAGALDRPCAGLPGH